MLSRRNIFLYGTLMSVFQRPGRARLGDVLAPMGRAWINATLFDLGIYPAAIPANDTRVWGEVHQMLDRDAVLSSLDIAPSYEPAQKLLVEILK